MAVDACTWASSRLLVAGNGHHLGERLTNLDIIVVCSCGVFDLEDCWRILVAFHSTWHAQWFRKVSDQ